MIRKKYIFYNIKINKIISNNTSLSRRKVDKLIILKKIKINNKLAYLGQKIKYKDNIFIKNKKLSLQFFKKIPKIIIYYKNNNEIVTNYDKNKRNIVFNNIPILKIKKWFFIGRLDLNTKGLLLFTNCGNLKNILSHPKYNIKRKYLIKINLKINFKIKNKMLKGVKYKNYILSINKISLKKYNKKYFWYILSIYEGKNKQIRNIFKIFKIKIINLIRIKYGIIYLPKYLKKNKWIYMNKIDVKKIYYFYNNYYINNKY